MIKLRKQLTKLLAIAFASLALSSCSSGGLISRTTNTYIQFSAYFDGHYNDLGKYNIEYVTDYKYFEIPGEEYQYDDEENGRYFADIIWERTKKSFKVADVKKYVKNHNPDYKREVKVRTFGMSIAIEIQKIYNVEYKFVGKDEKFKITYENVDNADLIYKVQGQDPYQEYSLNDLGGSFLNIGDVIVDNTIAYRLHDTFLGWRDEFGKEIDPTKLRKELTLYASWLSDFDYDKQKELMPDKALLNDFCSGDDTAKYKALGENEKLVRFHFPFNLPEWINRYPSYVLHAGETLTLDTALEFPKAPADHPTVYEFEQWSVDNFAYLYDGFSRSWVADDVSDYIYRPVSSISYNDYPFYQKVIDVYANLTFEYKEITLEIYNELGYIDHTDYYYVTYYNYKDFVFPTPIDKPDHIIIFENILVEEYKDYFIKGNLFDVTGRHRLLMIDYYFEDMDNPYKRIFLDNIYNMSYCDMTVADCAFMLINPGVTSRYAIEELYYLDGDEYVPLDYTLGIPISDYFDYGVIKIKIFDKYHV